MKTLSALLLLAICSPLVAAGNEGLYGEEIITSSYKGVPITIHARYTLKDRTRNCSVRNILDGKVSTVWCTRKLEETYDGQVPSLEIRFGKEVYLDEISIRTGCGKDQRGTIRFLGIEKTNTKIRTLEFGGHYKLKSDPVAQSVNIGSETKHKNIYDLFPARALRLEIYDVHADELEACVAELEMKLRKTLDYTPEYSWKEVKAYLDANADWWKADSGWDYRKRDTKDVQILNESHFTALTYYAIRGNKEAARLFFRHEPISAGNSAVMANHYKPLMRESLKQKGVRY